MTINPIRVLAVVTVAAIPILPLVAAVTVSAR